MEFDGKTINEVVKYFEETYFYRGADDSELTRAFQHFSNRGLMQACGGLREVLANQMDWSRRTFGSGRRTIGITKHIQKECAEVREHVRECHPYEIGSKP